MGDNNAIIRLSQSSLACKMLQEDAHFNMHKSESRPTFRRREGVSKKAVCQIKQRREVDKLYFSCAHSVRALLTKSDQFQINLMGYGYFFNFLLLVLA
jgi:hypothetical protein